MDHRPEPQIDLLNPLASLEWRECSEMPLAGMSDAQAVLLGKQVYLGGGDIHPGSSATLLIYDFTDDSWDLLNTPTENYALTIYNSQLVLVGGRNPITLNLTDELCVLDADQQHWNQSLPAMPIKCCQSSAVSTEHHLIVAGGLDDDLDPLDVVQVYDGHHWWRVEPLPKAGYLMKSSLLKGIWYLAGGDEQEREVFCTSLHSLIGTTGSDRNRQASVWKKLPNAPLEWCTPVTIGKQLAAVGGSSGGHSYSSAIYLYSNPTNAWVYVEDMPIACHSTCTVVLPTGELLTVGGEAKKKTLSCAFRAKIQIVTFPEGQLSMSAIERLKAVAGISIYNQLAPKFLRMTAALHLDPSTVTGLRAENNPIERPKAMFKAWLAGKSALPPTWNMLLEKLHAIQMGELAKKIEHFFNKASVTTPSPSLMSESKKVLELDVSAIESKEQQSKPDCRDVAVQSSPDYKDSAVQTRGEPTVAVTTGFVRGVEIVGETEFMVQDQGGSFEWRGYGMRLHVPKDSFTASIKECTINIRVSLSGHFQLPGDSDFLSPVFWIAAPCRFTKPVSLEIQHCALSEDETGLSHLTFVSTKCSQRDLPYIFRELGGGVFTTHTTYGSIQLSHFSGIGVTGKKGTLRSYCAHLYRTKKEDYEWRFYFVIVQDLVAKNTVVREHYGHFAILEATLRVRFEHSEITLGISGDGLVTKEGWRITPVTAPTITREDVDQYKKGRWIPECQLVVQWEREDQKPVHLRQKVDLTGAKAPHTFIHLILNPDTMPLRTQSTGDGDSNSHKDEPPSPAQVLTSTDTLADEDLLQIADYLLNMEKNHIYNLGLVMGLAQPKLKTMRDSDTFLDDVIAAWLRKEDNVKKMGEPSWTVLIRALKHPRVMQIGIADNIAKDKGIKLKS